MQPKAETAGGPSLRSTVRKSALLNVVIVATSLPVLLFAGGPGALAPTLAIMAGITLAIWAATFALFPFVSLGRIFRAPAPAGKRRGTPEAGRAGVADRWLDGPA